MGTKVPVHECFCILYPWKYCKWVITTHFYTMNNSKQQMNSFLPQACMSCCLLTFVLAPCPLAKQAKCAVYKQQNIVYLLSYCAYVEKDWAAHVPCVNLRNKMVHVMHCRASTAICGSEHFHAKCSFVTVDSYSSTRQHKSKGKCLPQILPLAFSSFAMQRGKWWIKQSPWHGQLFCMQVLVQRLQAIRVQKNNCNIAIPG